MGGATILVLFGIIGDKPVIRYPRYSDGTRIDLDPKDNDKLSYYDDLFSQFGDYLRSQPASVAIQMDVSKVWKRGQVYYVVDNVELQAQQAPISKTQKNARDLRWFILQKKSLQNQLKDYYEDVPEDEAPEFQRGPYRTNEPRNEPRQGPIVLGTVPDQFWDYLGKAFEFYFEEIVFSR